MYSKRRKPQHCDSQSEKNGEAVKMGLPNVFNLTSNWSEMLLP